MQDRCPAPMRIRVPQTADISGPGRHFAFVPEPDVATYFDTVGECHDARRPHPHISCSPRPPPAPARIACPSRGTWRSPPRRAPPPPPNPPPPHPPEAQLP